MSASEPDTDGLWFCFDLDVTVPGSSLLEKKFFKILQEHSYETLDIL